MEPYDSFLVRCWAVEDQVEREQSVFEVEHIQTGAKKRLETLVQAFDWIKSRSKATAGQNDDL